MHINVENIYKSIGEENIEILEEISKTLDKFSLKADSISNVPKEILDCINIREINLGLVPQKYKYKSEYDIGGINSESIMTKCCIVRKIAKGDFALSLSLPEPSLSVTPVRKLGTEQQKRDYFSSFDSDTPIWGAFGLS